MHEKARPGKLRSLWLSLTGGIALWMLLEGLHYFGIFSVMGDGSGRVLLLHFIAVSFGAICAAVMWPVGFAAAFYLLLSMAAFASTDILHELYIALLVDKVDFSSVAFDREAMLYLYATMYFSSMIGALISIRLFRRFAARRK